MNNRIRIDIKSRGRASVTKTSIVEAVRLLEQDKSIRVSIESRELIDHVFNNLKVTYSKDAPTLARVRIAFNAIDFTEGFRECTSVLCMDLAENTVLRIGTESCEPQAISEVLPSVLAKLIKQSALCTKSSNIDDFI